MTHADQVAHAELLERQIVAATKAERLALKPDFCAAIAGLEAEGLPVPSRMRRLEQSLIDEAIEAQFDNMPI
jgi:predicted transcriptional regulator